MLPLRDHNPSDGTPFVTWGLIAINVVVFLLYFPQAGSNPGLLVSVFDAYAMVPAEIGSGIDTHTVLTSMFLHGGWQHLILNMLFLYIFGDNVEDLLGHIGYLIFYLCAGVAAALAQMLSAPFSDVPMVGASGAIAGVMGGYLLLYPRARVDVWIMPIIWRTFAIPAFIVLGIWFVLQLFNGTASLGATGGGVAYWAHAGGFAAGLLFLLPVWLRRGGPSFWSQTHGTPPFAARVPEVARNRFANGPIETGGYERAAERRALSSSRIPQAGQRQNKPRPRGPWNGG